MSKILITSGCSFSDCSGSMPTWPKHLFKDLKPFGFTKHISSAMGSQGNGLISRGVIYNVLNALKTYEPQNILVGVMWSHSSRLDYRCTHPELLSFKTNVDGWVENPTSFVENARKNWVIMNQHWQNHEAQNYYKHYHDWVGVSIYSIEHILRTQFILQTKGIKYFFTDFVDNNIVDVTSLEYQNNAAEVDYLYQEIDKSYYLPVSSEHRWVYDNSSNKEEFKKRHWYNGKESDWIHPAAGHHKEFTEQVIMPWLHSKNFI